ncbi:Deoxyguanosinetriphosphate triphosphohydrolase [Pseudovibrio axinellae]|uniref:Deoxyguanosinetriphosphate triphosphohydrolase-like protein n=1 Tax=Pseudovibrio axinellae TaxID=989403 RepID=A0A165YJ89_9HYPH|nr:anti-phage deoxyguanosine triphosphatase [Pseudovibrio axinellae]KZL18891.1 Deoxyguanosinetriphosphate triphosphohydrolase [Pseudovibrio axinellae]SEP88819.1 dGTPase [Pseudovibrio axinellae]
MSIDWNERQEPSSASTGDPRSTAEVDFSRIVHSHAFRRLQGKTQILNLGDSDFYRTRLTHTLEVAQIASGLVLSLRHNHANHIANKYLPCQTQVQTISYCHDLGHPPFGHGGEVALNYCMRNHGGFEGNGQTLRLISRLEKMSKNHGLNFTRRTLLGTLKYPAPFSKTNNGNQPVLNAVPTALQLIDRESAKPPKCYLDSESDIVEWVLSPLSASDRNEFTRVTAKEGKSGKTSYKSFDCSIMDLADDIAYGVHDFEDAIALNMVNEQQFRAFVKPEQFQSFIDSLNQQHPGKQNSNGFDGIVEHLFTGEANMRKMRISQLVHHFISSVYIAENGGLSEPQLRYKAALPSHVMPLLNCLKSFVFERVIKSPGVQQLEFKGQKMVVSVFEVLQSEPQSFLPEATYKTYMDAGEDMRVICDHIAGMTDNYLMKTYDRLFSPRMGSIFDRI